MSCGSETARAVAVDVGGASVRVGWLGSPTVTRCAVGRETSPSDLVVAVEEALAAAHCTFPDTMVVAVPTYVGDDGRLLDCPSLPHLTGTPLADLLRDRLGARTVEVRPDLACAALGEARLGRGRGVRRLVVVALGTGANAAAVVDGALVETAYGCLGDAGHVLVDPFGPLCPCGGRGCLESLCSGWALAAAAHDLGLSDAAARVGAAATGHAGAQAVVTRAGIALGRAISTWSVMLWPDVVAVAGGLSQAGEALLAPARAELHRVAPPYVGDRISVERADLGAHATLVGALLLASGDEPLVTEWAARLP